MGAFWQEKDCVRTLTRLEGVSLKAERLGQGSSWEMMESGWARWVESTDLMDVHEAEGTGRGTRPQGWGSIQEEAQGSGMGVGVGMGGVVPKEEEQTWREMLFLELLLHTVSMTCPGSVQGSRQASSSPPCGCPLPPHCPGAVRQCLYHFAQGKLHPEGTEGFAQGSGLTEGLHCSRCVQEMMLGCRSLSRSGPPCCRVWGSLP